MEYKCFLNKNENYNGRIQFLFGYKENGKKLELELRRDSIWLINYRTLTEEKFEKSNFEYENPTSEGNYMVSCIARLYIYIHQNVMFTYGAIVSPFTKEYRVHCACLSERHSLFLAGLVPTSIQV